MTDKTKQEKWEEKIKQILDKECFLCEGYDSFGDISEILQLIKNEIEEAKKEAVREYDKDVFEFTIGKFKNDIVLLEAIKEQRKQALEKRGIRE